MKSDVTAPPTLLEGSLKPGDYFVTDQIVYLCEPGLGKLKSDSTRGIDWISKYKVGDLRIEFNVRLVGERENHLDAVVEILSDELTDRLDANNFKPKRVDRDDSVFVGVAELVQIGKSGNLWRCPSLVGLKRFHDCCGLDRNTTGDLLEAASLVMEIDGETRSAKRFNRVGQGQLPSQLVKRRSHAVSKVSGQRGDYGWNRGELNRYCVDILPKVVLLRDGVWFGVDKCFDLPVELVEVVFRPQGLVTRIFNPKHEVKCFYDESSQQQRQGHEADHKQ